MNEPNFLLAFQAASYSSLQQSLSSPSLSSSRPLLSSPAETLSSQPSSSSVLEPSYNSSITQLSGWLEFDPQWHVFCLFLLVVAGVVGNSLVCVAVCVEKKLQNVTNYFLVSLAIADLLVSLVVMPCCIVQEFVGYWPLGVVLCNTWLVADVTLCTSSIMHMCTISMDRYLGVKFPLKMRNRSTFIVGVKVVLVWLFSLTLASPLVFIGISDSIEILNSEGQCGIFNPYFLVYGSLVAFFVPFLIMLVTYTLTIRLLSKRAEMLKSVLSEVSLIRSVGRKKVRRMRSVRSTKWASLTSTTESSTENELVTRFPVRRSKVLRGNVKVVDQNAEKTTFNSRGGLNARSSDSEVSESVSTADDSKSFKRKTKRSLRRVLMEPMIRKKLKSRPPNIKQQNVKDTRTALDDSNQQTPGMSSDVLDCPHVLPFKSSISRRFRRGSLKCFEDPDTKTRRFYDEVSPDIHKQRSRNSAPPSYTNLSSNFSKALPTYFKYGKEKLQIKTDIPVAGKCRPRQFRNLLRPTLSLDASRIQYEMYRNSDESVDWRKESNKINKDWNWRNREFEDPLQSVETISKKSTSQLDISSTCQSFEKNASGVDSPLNSFVEKFLVSRDAGRHGQMNSVKTEKKAVKVLGAMFCFFSLCWASFFIMNTFMGICRNCSFSSILFKCFLWLGYSSSIVNPIIYTIFNKAFKQTFQSLLTCSTRCFLSSSTCCSCCIPKKKAVRPNAIPTHRRSTTTTTTTSSSYCRRLSTRKSIAISFSEEWLERHHIRFIP